MYFLALVSISRINILCQSHDFLCYYVNILAIPGCSTSMLSNFHLIITLYETSISVTVTSARVAVFLWGSNLVFKTGVVPGFMSNRDERVMAAR